MLYYNWKLTQQYTDQGWLKSIPCMFCSPLLTPFNQHWTQSLKRISVETRWLPFQTAYSNTVLLIKFLPSLPVTAQRGSAPSAPCPPERATSGIATCSVVGDIYRPVAKLSPALGWWTPPCLACLWARIRARPVKQSAGWRNTVTKV